MKRTMPNSKDLTKVVIFIILFIALIVSVFFIGCGKKYCERKLNLKTETNDSSATHTETIKLERDTFVQLLPDSSMLAALFECNEDKKVILKEVKILKEGKPDIIYKYIPELQKLFIKAKLPREEIKLTVRDTWNKLYKENWHKTVLTVTKEVEKELSWMQKTLIIYGSISAVFTLFFIIFMVWKTGFYKKFLNKK